MKKKYMMPTMQVVVLKQKCHILAGSPVGSARGNVFNQDNITGSNGQGRSRAVFEWDDWED